MDDPPAMYGAAAAAAAADAATASAAGTAEREGSARFALILGPMFSGKTSSVWRALERARIAGLPAVLVRHAADDRDGPGAEDGRTHGGIRLRSAPPSPCGDAPARGGARPPAGGALPPPAALRIVSAGRLADVRLAADERVVGVDEAQFFDDLAPAVEGWLAEGRQVFAAALDGDFRRRPFPPVCAALPLATSVAKLHAVCMLCPRRPGVLPRAASYTARLPSAPRVAGEDQVAVGGSEAYRAACGPCFRRLALQQFEGGGGAPIPRPSAVPRPPLPASVPL